MRICKSKMTLQYLRECFDLDADAGELVWRVRPRSHFASTRSMTLMNGKYAGCIAGHVVEKFRPRGYFLKRLMLAEGNYPVHRLVYALHHGIEYTSLPSIIDHIDCNALNNRPDNLRAASPRQSQYNKRISLNNTLGEKGIAICDVTGKWIARIRDRGVRTHLGTFETKEEAAAAYRGAAVLLHGEFFRER